MKTLDLIEYINEKYAISAEYLWQKYPQICVFRHKSNQKWFALLMDGLEREKLSQKYHVEIEFAKIDVLNVKTDPEYAATVLLDYKKIFPAYHMNKKHWISLVLNNFKTPSEIEELKSILDFSYHKTANKKSKN